MFRRPWNMPDAYNNSFVRGVTVLDGVRRQQGHAAVYATIGCFDRALDEAERRFRIIQRCGDGDGDAVFSVGLDAASLV